MSGRKKTTRYLVSFTLKVEGDESDASVEEAVTSLIDEELYAHTKSATRCGVRFIDAVEISVREEE